MVPGFVIEKTTGIKAFPGGVKKPETKASFFCDSILRKKWIDGNFRRHIFMTLPSFFHDAATNVKC